MGDNGCIKIETAKEALKELGIHYIFIPSNLHIDYLENPIKLIENKYDLIKGEQ